MPVHHGWDRVLFRQREKTRFRQTSCAKVCATVGGRAGAAGQIREKKESGVLVPVFVCGAVVDAAKQAIRPCVEGRGDDDGSECDALCCFLLLRGGGRVKKPPQIYADDAEGASVKNRWRLSTQAAVFHVFCGSPAKSKRKTDILAFQ